MYIECVAVKTPVRDSAYGTGEWLQGQVKLVPEAIGRQMLKHTDVFVTASPDKVATATRAGAQSLVPVRCITNRALHVDTLYGTGEWIALEVKAVKADTAKKMAQHVDVFELAPEEANAPEAPTAQPDADDKDIETRNFLRTATIEQLLGFASANFQQEIHRRDYRTRDNLQIMVEGLYNQYGTRA
jgi:hypothetical protein